MARKAGHSGNSLGVNNMAVCAFSPSLPSPLVWASRTLVEAETEVGSDCHQVGEDVGLFAFE